MKNITLRQIRRINETNEYIDVQISYRKQKQNSFVMPSCRNSKERKKKKKLIHPYIFLCIYVYRYVYIDSVCLGVTFLLLLLRDPTRFSQLDSFMQSVKWTILSSVVYTVSPRTIRHDCDIVPFPQGIYDVKIFLFSLSCFAFPSHCQ